MLMEKTFSFILNSVFDYNLVENLSKQFSRKRKKNYVFISWPILCYLNF